MVHQLPRSNLPSPDNHRVKGHYVSPGTSPTIQNIRLTGGHSHVRAQASHPRSQYLSNHPSWETGNIWGTRHHGFTESGYVSHPGFTSLPPLPMTRGHSHSLGIEVHDPGNSLGDRQEIHNIPPGMPQSEVGPNGGTSPATPPLEAGRYMTRGPANSFDAPEHMMGQWRREDGRPVFANPKPNCPRAVQHGWGESTTVHQFPINYGQKTPSPSQAHGAPALLDIYSDDRPHQNGVKYGPHLQVLNMSRPDNLGPNSFTTGGHNPLQRGANGGTTGTIWYAGHSVTHSPCNKGVECDGDLTETPHPARNRHSIPGRRGKEAEDLEIVVLAPRSARRSDSGGQRDFGTLLPVIPPATPTSSQFVMIQQIPYKCPTLQRDWIRQSPIEFGCVKLTDAADLGHIGIPDYNHHVLNYKGVGSSILCRLEFSNHEIGKWKISTTDHKTSPQPITKKKLAFEVAKFVERHLETIRAQDDYGGVTFEDIVLTKLHHVSKASWQPELWYKAVTAGSNPP